MKLTHWKKYRSLFNLGLALRAQIETENSEFFFKTCNASISAKWLSSGGQPRCCLWLRIPGKAATQITQGLKNKQRKHGHMAVPNLKHHPISSIIQYVAFTLADWVSKQVWSLGGSLNHFCIVLCFTYLYLRNHCQGNMDTSGYMECKMFIDVLRLWSVALLVVARLPRRQRIPNCLKAVWTHTQILLYIYTHYVYYSV